MVESPALIPHDAWSLVREHQTTLTGSSGDDHQKMLKLVQRIQTRREILVGNPLDIIVNTETPTSKPLLVMLLVKRVLAPI